MNRSSVPFVDLTDVDTSDEEVESGSSESEEEEVRSKRCSATISVCKFTQVKFCRNSRLQLRRPGSADVVHPSCFSVESRVHYKELIDSQKETYVGHSTNPFVGNGLFAATRIEEGEFICVYRGLRMSIRECKARIKAGCNTDYILNLTQGVYVDGFQVEAGAAMANHSCRPNSELQYVLLRGIDKAPVGILRALKDIEAGEEIETSYNMWEKKKDGMPDLSDLSSYVPYRRLKPECEKVLRVIKRNVTNDGKQRNC